MANKINMLPKQAGDQLTAPEFNNIVSKIDAAIDELNTANYNIGQQNNAIQALAKSDVTYAQLMTLINAAQLTPGKLYRITDYRTVHYLVDGNGQHIIDDEEEKVIITGPVEPLTVLAVSTSTLGIFAYSELYPGDIIKYDPTPANWLQNYAFTPDNLTIIPGFKGVIYRREDDKKNIRCNFDFRNVKMRMYSVRQPEWAAGTYLAGDFVTHTNVVYVAKTETSAEPSVMSSEWHPMINIVRNEYLSFYHDVLFQNAQYPIPINANEYIDTVVFEDINENSNVVFEESNDILYALPLSHIGATSSQIYLRNAHALIIGSGCHGIGIDTCNNIIILENSLNVNLGYDCVEILIGGHCGNVNIGSGAGSVYLYENCTYIKTADVCSNIFIKQSGNIDIGKNSSDIAIGADGSSIKIGENCSSITIGNTCQALSFGSNCFDLVIPDIAWQNVFEEFVSDVDYTDVAVTQVGVPVYVHHMRNLMGSASQYYMGESEGNPTLLYFNNIINTMSD